MGHFKSGGNSVWCAETIAYIFFVITTGTVTGLITLPDVDDVVAGRPYTLQCRITRPDTPYTVSWNLVNEKQRIAPLYESGSCEQSIPLVNPSYSIILSGQCQAVGNEEIYKLTILNVTERDEDFVWRCSLATPRGAAVDHVTLSVKVMVTGVAMTIQPSTVLEGTTITSTCVTSPSKPGACVGWFIRRQGTGVRNITAGQPACNQDSTKVQTTTRTLTFTATAEDNGASLYCTAINRVTDTPVSSQEYQLDIQYGPLLINCDDSYTVVENQTVELSCTAWAKPNARFTWKREQTELNHTESGSNHRLTSKINLSKVGTSDAGIYVLTVNNGVGAEANKHINLIVQYAPTVTVEVTNGNEVTEGSNLELICHAEGMPQTYTYYPWTHHVGREVIPIPLIGSRSGRRLLIINVSFIDQGFYQCSAANGIGGKQANRTEIKIRTSPKFTTQKTRIFSDLNKNVTIKVDFVSYPAATIITWYVYSTDIVSESLIGTDGNGRNKYTTKTTNLKHSFTFYGKTVPISGQVEELGISNVNRKDFKRYLLIVENKIGSSNITVSLEIADRPCPPLLNNPVCGVSKANISWISCFDGGYKQTFFVEIKKGEQDWTLHKETFLDTGENNSVSSEILDLEPSQIYSFRVQAKNQVGQRYSAEKRCTVLKGVTHSVATPSSQTSVAGIIDGVISGIAIVAIVVVVILFRRKIHLLTEQVRQLQPPNQQTEAIPCSRDSLAYQTISLSSNGTTPAVYENQLSHAEYVNDVTLNNVTTESQEPAYEKLRVIPATPNTSNGMYENTQI